jgi:hypothetical protein
MQLRTEALLIVFSSVTFASTVNIQASNTQVTVGAPVHFSASTDFPDGSTVRYRYRARRAGGEFETIRDFGPQTDLDWTTIDRDGTYQIEVAAQNLDTGETTFALANIALGALIQNGKETVTPTSNALVFIFSSPACKAGGRMRVSFHTDGGATTNTPFKNCTPAHPLNFYLAGMLAQTLYHAHSTLQAADGTTTDGAPIDYTSGSLPSNLKFTQYTVSTPAPASASQPILLHSPLSAATTATDLNGNVLWYYPGSISSLTRPEAGVIFGFLQDPSQDPAHQYLRAFDLAGVTLKETNAERVTSQLHAMGFQGITAFHHEVRAIPGGRVMALGATEQILTDVQGPGAIDVLSDMIVVLDSDLNVVWAWDAIQWLDPKRLATLNETCTNAGGGCPPIYLAQKANDWLHGNALEYVSDGNILYSSRHQDWVIKISFDGGNGDGHILWKLGKGGDFTYADGDPYPWFSHQHDPALLPGAGTRMTVFDNGNVRAAADSSAHSRGQVLLLDETNMTASLALNMDMGAYSYALGSAHRLEDGGFHFELGIISGTTNAQSVEVDRKGSIVYQLNSPSPEYRTFRLDDLYSSVY